MTFFLGLDIGGTKSDALIVDSHGCAKSYSRGGAGNPNSVGLERFTELVRSLVEEVLSRAGLEPNQIAGAGMGVGGFDWESESERTTRPLRLAGIRAPVKPVNDAYLGILAGTDEGWGVAVVSGTGSNCRGRDRRGREGRVTGYGPLLGEGFGAGELAIAALRAIALEWTRRGPATRLTSAFTEKFGVGSSAELIEKVTTQPNLITGAEAPLIFQLAAEGDAVALDLVLAAARTLASLACGVIRQLELENDPVPVVMVGGMWNGSPLLVETFRATLRSVAPRAEFRRLNSPPVIGAVMLGMELAGLEPFSLRPRLIVSATELIKAQN